MMEINIKVMKDDAYKTLEKNYEDVYDMIKNHPSDSSWLKEYLGFEPYIEKKYVIDSLNLKYDEDYSEVALYNSIEIYEKLKDLPRYILCDNKFWAWVTFDLAYKQAIKSIELKSPDIIKNWWLIGESRRALMLGTISRHFFRTEISVDEDREDKYELTWYLLSNSKSYQNLVFRNIGMLKNVSLAYLSAELDISKKYDKPVYSDLHRELMKDASRIGSVMLIDVLSKEEIYNILYKKLDEYMIDRIKKEPEFLKIHSLSTSDTIDIHIFEYKRCFIMVSHNDINSMIIEKIDPNLGSFLYSGTFANNYRDYNKETDEEDFLPYKLFIYKTLDKVNDYVKIYASSREKNKEMCEASYNYFKEKGLLD